MSGYEYGNARLRAMRSRLLPRNEIFQFVQAGSLSEFIGLLARTPYRKSVEVALVQASDLESIFAALRTDFVESVRKIRGFYDESELALIDLILSAYDVHNLKTVLRGLAHHLPHVEINNALLPVGQLSEPALAAMMRASTPREAIDVLATIGHPFAQPLVILRTEHPGADLLEMEQVFERWHFHEIERALKDPQDNERQVLTALWLEADINNLMVALRFVQSPNEQKVLKIRQGGNGLQKILVGIGSISAEQLNLVYMLRNVKAAVDLLGDLPFTSALKEGVGSFERSGRLSDIEKALRRYQLHWLAWQIAKDPLGIGVVQGYLALKSNEIANLRRIARGVQLQTDPEIIREELEFLE